MMSQDQRVECPLLIDSFTAEGALVHKVFSNLASLQSLH